MIYDNFDVIWMPLLAARFNEDRKTALFQYFSPISFFRFEKTGFHPQMEEFLHGNATEIGLGLMTMSMIVVCWLLNIPATCECTSGTYLLRQFYGLPH